MPLVRQIQTALFCSSLYLRDKIRAATDVISATGGSLDGEPTIVPVPEDAPGEIPRIILRSKDDALACNIGRTRVDWFFHSRADELPEMAEACEKHRGHLGGVVEATVDSLRGHVLRVGVVFTIVKTVADPSQYIQDHWLKEGAFGGATEAECRILQRRDSSLGEVNRWLTVASRGAPIPGLSEKFVTVAFDVNTLPEKELDLTAEQVSSFFDEAAKMAGDEIDGILAD